MSATRATSGRSRDILAHAGKGNSPRLDDMLMEEDARP